MLDWIYTLRPYIPFRSLHCAIKMLIFCVVPLHHIKITLIVCCACSHQRVLFYFLHFALHDAWRNGRRPLYFCAGAMFAILVRCNFLLFYSFFFVFCIKSHAFCNLSFVALLFTLFCAIFSLSFSVFIVYTYKRVSKWTMWCV